MAVPACTAPKRGHITWRGKQQCPACRLVPHDPPAVSIAPSLDAATIERIACDLVARLDDGGSDWSQVADKSMPASSNIALSAFVWKNAQGMVHRVGAPAEVVIGVSKADGQAFVASRQWCTYGRPDRLDGPALTLYSQDRGVIEEAYFRHGLRHRDDGGPAHIVYRGDGSRKETWAINGMRHRDGAPAIIDYSPAGHPVREEYYKDGLIHRTDGPASIRYFEYPHLARPTVRTEEWYFENDISRIDGPASVEYSPNGEVATEKFQVMKDGLLVAQDEVGVLAHYLSERVGHPVSREAAAAAAHGKTWREWPSISSAEVALWAGIYPETAPTGSGGQS